MNKIRVLNADIANKIAAGEVVERPASVVKELVENAIDAGASKVTVEIKNGGLSYIRVTDNGCGIAVEEAEIAFFKHATSKISSAEDLESILTLGFRGEALSSIAAVSRIELLTKRAESTNGSRLELEGGDVKSSGAVGCPDGTTIIVRDLFFNLPARMKFLKTDRTEASYIADILERLALGNLGISFKLISDERQKLQTSGDGTLRSAIYSVYGADYAKSIREVSSAEDSLIKVSGFAGLPATFRSGRSFQSFFVNGRYIRSKLLTAAAEEAYKNRIMTGKYPFFVLHITLPPELIDVNVHPAKTEIKFSDEKAAFRAVYWAVKNALEMQEDVRPAAVPSAPPPPLTTITPPPPILSAGKQMDFIKEFSKPVSSEFVVLNEPEAPPLTLDEKPECVPPKDEEPEIEYRLIGSAFGGYLILERGSELIFIDQHATHERKIYEELKRQKSPLPQSLLTPVSITLTQPETELALSSRPLLESLGFDFDQFGDNVIVVREAPSELDISQIGDTFVEVLGNIALSKSAPSAEILERSLFTLACKAAVKVTQRITQAEALSLADWALANEGRIDTCPHGRPIIFALSKSRLEKEFKRT